MWHTWDERDASWNTEPGQLPLFNNVNPRRPSTSTHSSSSYGEWGLRIGTMTGNRCSVCSRWQFPPASVVSFISPIRREAACCVISQLHSMREANWLRVWRYTGCSSKANGEGRLNAYYLFMLVCHSEKDLPGCANKIQTFGLEWAWLHKHNLPTVVFF